MRNIVPAILALAAAGCVSAYTGSARPADPSVLSEPGWNAVRDVPVILQASERDCGAAAMAMVLGFFGEKLDPATLASPRADALRDFARSRGFEAFVVPASLEDLEGELRDGRPVLVGVIKPQIGGDVAHYEVVVGIDRSGDRIATHDPARGLTVNSLGGFEREWEPTQRLAIVIAPKETRGRNPSR